MEKRIIIAFILSFGILYAFRAFYAPPEPVPSPGGSASATAPANAPAPSPEPPKTVETNQAPLQPSAPVGDIQSDKAQDTIVDTPLYTATISNAGAVLTSYKLKAYSDGEGRPLELINAIVGEKVGWPLALQSEDTTLNGTLAKALFVPRQDGDRVVLEYAAVGVH